MYINLLINNIFRADYSRWTQYGVGQRKSQEQIRNYINLSEDQTFKTRFVNYH